MGTYVTHTLRTYIYNYVLKTVCKEVKSHLQNTCIPYAQEIVWKRVCCEARLTYELVCDWKCQHTACVRGRTPTYELVCCIQAFVCSLYTLMYTGTTVHAITYVTASVSIQHAYGTVREHYKHINNL